MKDQPRRLASSFVDRRQFLKWLGFSGISLLAAACQRSRPAETPSPAPRTPTFVVPSPSPSPSATASRTKTSTPPPKAIVAIGQVNTYDPALLRREMERMLSEIDGLSDQVKAGSRVGDQG